LAHAESVHGVVFAANDLRFFCNLTRQKMVLMATDELIQKLIWLAQAVTLRGTGSASRLRLCLAEHVAA
jgi:hypothetical protein